MEQMIHSLGICPMGKSMVYRYDLWKLFPLKVKKNNYSENFI